MTQTTRKGGAMDKAVRQKVNSYKFEKISSQMGKAFGTIRKGDEEAYAFQLFPMESNLLKTSRIRKAGNGRRAAEAVRICLFIIDGYINNITYDLDEYLTDDVSAFVSSLLMSFDPFVNNNISSIANSEGIVDISSSESLREYFENPVKCLLRIESSIEIWTRQFGINGYFNFLEETLGHMVPDDDKMDFAIKAATRLET
jgi:hypothetical protein